jgi:hypothetical protein
MRNLLQILLYTTSVMFALSISIEVAGEYQCGFRPNRSAIDQIFVMRQTMERCYEYNADLHMLFIDFRQAFDSICRNQLFMALEYYCIP